MRTFAATVLVAAACFLVFADAQATVKRETTVKAATTLKPTNVTTTKPTIKTRPTITTVSTTTTKPTATRKTATTTKATNATSLKPATVATITLNPVTTTLKPASVSTLKPTIMTTPVPSPGTNYCKISTCSVPTDNTLCKYSIVCDQETLKLILFFVIVVEYHLGMGLPTGLSASIERYSVVDIAIILKVLNEYRRKVAQGIETQGSPGPQPPASNMRELKWDQELAVMAAAHAQQCVYKHDTCRDVPRFSVGQNIYIAASSTNNLGISDWKAAITSWYNEVQYMNATYIKSFPRSPPNVIGHYTQVVWADTYLVGCAVAYYQSTATFGSRNLYNRFYVCNYGPTGNRLGSPVYKPGTAGSACPTGTANRNGLCVSTQFVTLP